MKYLSKIYAEALIDLLLEKDREEEKQSIIANFLKFVKKNGDESSLKKIFEACQKLYLKRIGKKKITFEVARSNKNNEDILKSTIEAGDIIEERINPEIIAGVKIIVDEERQLDCSLLKKIKNLY